MFTLIGGIPFREPHSTARDLASWSSADLELLYAAVLTRFNIRQFSCQEKLAAIEACLVHYCLTHTCHEYHATAHICLFHLQRDCLCHRKSPGNFDFHQPSESLYRKVVGRPIVRDAGNPIFALLYLGVSWGPALILLTHHQLTAYV